MIVVDPAPEFTGDDGFLYAVLGLLTASQAVTAAGEAAASAGDDSAPGHGPGDDPVLCALLGLIRLAAQATAVVTSWAVEDPSEEPPSDAPARASGDILR